MITPLQQAIDHWQAIADGKPFKLGPRHCALCREFNRHYENECLGCPVAEATGKAWCEATPVNDFLHWYDAQGAPRQLTVADHAVGILLANAQLDFLKGLMK